MVVGSSVSWTACYKVFLNGRICWIVSVMDSMRQSFPEWPYMVVGSSVSRTAFCKVFLNGHIWLLDRQCHAKHVSKFSWIIGYSYSLKTVQSSFTEIMSSERDRGREALLRCHRELYRQHRKRETPDESLL